MGLLGKRLGLQACGCGCCSHTVLIWEEPVVRNRSSRTGARHLRHGVLGIAHDLAIVIICVLLLMRHAGVCAAPVPASAAGIALRAIGLVHLLAENDSVPDEQEERRSERV